MSIKFILFFIASSLLFESILASEINLLIVSEQKSENKYSWEDNKYSWEATLLTFDISQEMMPKHEKKIITKSNKKLILFRAYPSKLYALGCGNENDLNGLEELFVFDENGMQIAKIKSPEDNGFLCGIINAVKNGDTILLNSIKCFDLDNKKYEILSYDPQQKTTTKGNEALWIAGSDRYNTKIRPNGQIEVISYGLSGNFQPDVLSSDFVSKEKLNSGYWFSILKNDNYQIFQFNDEKDAGNDKYRLLIYDKILKNGKILKYPSEFRISSFCCDNIIFTPISYSSDTSSSRALFYNYTNHKFMTLNLPVGGKLLGIKNNMFFVSCNDKIIVLKKNDEEYKVIYTIPFPDSQRIIAATVLNHYSSGD